MAVKMQSQKVAELNNEIGSLRKSAIWRAAMKDPTVARELNKIASIAVKAVSDPELEVEEKVAVVRDCADAVAVVGNSRRSYETVAIGVRGAVKIIEETVKGTALEGNEEMAMALERARRSIWLCRRFRDEGGAGEKASPRDREGIAAEQKYREYCETRGAPNDEAEIPAIISWIRDQIGKFKYSDTTRALEGLIGTDITARKQD